MTVLVQPVQNCFRYSSQLLFGTPVYHQRL